MLTRRESDRVASPQPDIGNLPLGDLVKFLIDGLGGPSYDRLSAASGGAIAATSLQNLANGGNEIGRVPEVKTLIGAAKALTHTTPWALGHASLISLERIGLTGRVRDREVEALSMLPRGWHTMEAADFAAWRSDGEARISARRVTELEQQLAAEREKTERLEAQVEKMKAAQQRRRSS